MSTIGNHNDTPDVDDVAPLSAADSECLSALQEVLEKHGMHERFGVTLLHKHFDLEDSEIMLETQNIQDRILTSKPVQISQLSGQQLTATAWRFRDKKIQIVGACASGPYGGQSGSHYGYKSD